MAKKIQLVIDNTTINEYEKYYFKIHTKANKKPIEHPYHPTINTWMIMKRPMMNAQKQRWKDFTVWYIDKNGYTNLKIKKCEMKFITYYGTNRRHDVDAATPKFLLDGFTESGFIVDDDYLHLSKITLECGVDKENPRTEIEVTILE